MRSWTRPAAVFSLFALDRGTKVWAQDWLLPRSTWPILPFFRFTYVENTGAAFGVGFSRNRFFVVFSVLLLGVLLGLQKRWKDKNLWIQAGLVLVTAGALGNLYDRIAYGYVVDFLDFRVWPVFNVADSCVCVGAACLAWGMRAEDDAKAKRVA